MGEAQLAAQLCNLFPFAWRQHRVDATHVNTHKYTQTQTNGC